LKTAKRALDSYDALQAGDALKPLLNFTHSEKVDTLLEKATFALDDFNFQSTLKHIEDMEKLL
jgi:hypothetical protein